MKAVFAILLTGILVALSTITPMSLLPVTLGAAFSSAFWGGVLATWEADIDADEMGTLFYV
jgi:hypothetical protein